VGTISKIVAIATVPAWLVIHAGPAAAQTFNDRWSVIPKAHAEPAPEPPNSTNQSARPFGTEPLTKSPEFQSALEHPKRAFSGKASFYSYSKGKTASGSSFDRDMLTAAHRNLPFGTKVRVTDVTTGQSVVVNITDRGPFKPDRVLDLSLAAARILGIEDRGVVEVRAEVL